MTSSRHDDPRRHGHSHPWMRCTCGKRGYGSRKIAKRAARTHHGDHLGVYECTSGMWHVGHLPRAVMAGKVTRQDVYRTV